MTPDATPCRCHHGTDDGVDVMWINAGCPIHGSGIARPPIMSVHVLETFPDGGQRRVVLMSRELIEAAQRKAEIP